MSLPLLDPFSWASCISFPNQIHFEIPIFRLIIGKIFDSQFKKVFETKIWQISVSLINYHCTVRWSFSHNRKLDNFRKATHLCKKRRTSGDSSSLECGSYVMKNDKEQVFDVKNHCEENVRIFSISENPVLAENFLIAKKKFRVGFLKNIKIFQI